jgi:RNA polymerase sigma-70 factor (ECF subfamily)
MASAAGDSRRENSEREDAPHILTTAAVAAEVRGWDDRAAMDGTDLQAGLIRIRGDGLARAEPVTDRDRSDAGLIRAARDGSQDALEALFRRHWRSAHHAAYLVCLDPAGAEDIAQEAFLAAVRSLERFDARQPFAPWLRRIVVNRAIDWTRMRAARHEITTATVPDDATATDPDRAGSEDLLRALAALPADHRAVIVLRYVHDLTPGEIARTLELPRGTVNSRLRRGLDSLRRQLEREAIR